MNQHETATEKLQRQQGAVADLRLDRGSDEETQRAVIEEAARRATTDSWPEMPEDERKGVVEAVVDFEGLSYQWAIFRRGWTTGQSAARIPVDPEVAGPGILVRAYATAEADTVRMKSQAGGLSTEGGTQPSLEERLRRYLPPTE